MEIDNQSILFAITNSTALVNMTEDIASNVTTENNVRAVANLPWNNPSNLMSKELSDEILFVLQCIVFPTLTVFGVLGNLLSLIVMLQKKLRESPTSYVLIALALSDTLFLLTNMVRKSTGIIKVFDPLMADTFNAKTFSYMFYLKTSFSRVSTLLVVVISTERFIAVALPLKVRSIVTKTRMIIVIIACVIIVFCGLAPLPAQYTYTYYGLRPYISQTKFALDNVRSLKVYNEYILPIVFRHIPVLVVLFLNIAIIILLKRSRSIQRSASQANSKRSEEQKKITRVLLSIAVFFLICLIPGDVLLLASTTIEGFSFFGKYHNMFLALSDFSLLFEMVNSSINFIIYMVLNRNFYRKYVELFCSCTRKTVLSPSVTSTASNKTRKTDTDDCSAGGKKFDDIHKIESSSGYEGSDCRL